MIIFVHAYEEGKIYYGRPAIFTSEGNLNQLGEWAEQFILNLNLGVDIFFLISGFLITNILLTERERYGKVNIGNFIMRRTLRIWPLYFLLIGLAPLLIIYVEKEQPNYLMNLLFLGNYDVIFTKVFTWPLAHYWTLCVEEHFYLVWPFIMAFVPMRHLPKAMLGVILLSMASRLYYFYASPDYSYHLYLNTLCRIDVLALGSLGGYFYWKRKFHFSMPVWLRYTFGILLLVSMALDSGTDWPDIWSALFKKYYFVALVAILMLDYNFSAKHKESKDSRGVLKYLGKISYGIYMYGNILIHIVTTKIMTNNNLDSMALFFSLIIAMTLVLSAASYKWFEEPILRLKSRFSNVRTAH